MKSVLVVGGGIAGIQASLDLAEMGVKVYLIEKSPSIGGHMAMLDKTFPTNDCAMCVLGPKMAEVERHKNIELLAYSELRAVRKVQRNFRVKILKKSRYVDESKCTGCGDCAKACLLKGKVDDEHNLGLGKRAASYLPFPQAFPLIYTIDYENCLFLKWGVCGKEPACKKACKAGAIDFSQKPIEVALEVSAIIVAIGLAVYDPSNIAEYGYGSFRNVLTALELERLLSASGPTGGQIKTFDGKTPSKVAFIQCVGSRDTKHNSYCSSICCMLATKQAILIKERYPEADICIYYTDLRSSGKNSQEYVERAEKDFKINYIRSRPGEIIKDQKNNNLKVLYNFGKKVMSREADLVILVNALVHNDDANRISNILGIALDDNGFFKVKDLFCAPLDTCVPGIFVCGSCKDPSSITDSVLSASGAVSRAMEWIGVE